MWGILTSIECLCCKENVLKNALLSFDVAYFLPLFYNTEGCLVLIYTELINYKPYKKHSCVDLGCQQRINKL